MAGGGTGGHVVPSLAVAEELRRRGHECVFIGVKQGVEAKLVPAADFPIEWINIRGFQRTSIWNRARTLVKLPWAVLRSRRLLRRHQAAAVFSSGGYVAGPVMIAASWCRIPMVLMEPNAMPGLVSRKMARRVARALISFPETAEAFPPGVAELAGLPVRAAFFDLPMRPPRDPLTILVTGGSLGARALNRTVRDSWRLFKAAGVKVRWIVQTGEAEAGVTDEALKKLGVEGRVAPFFSDMPAVFDEADLIIGRAGAGACAEIRAAGKPALLVPFPFAADDHQTANARALAAAGAALEVPEAAFTPRRLFEIVDAFVQEPALLETMAKAARVEAKAGAARRAAEVLEEIAVDTASQRRNN